MNRAKNSRHFFFKEYFFYRLRAAFMSKQAAFAANGFFYYTGGNFIPVFGYILGNRIHKVRPDRKGCSSSCGKNRVSIIKSDPSSAIKSNLNPLAGQSLSWAMNNRPFLMASYTSFFASFKSLGIFFLRRMSLQIISSKKIPHKCLRERQKP